MMRGTHYVKLSYLLIFVKLFGVNIVQLVTCTQRVQHVALCFFSTCMSLLGATLFWSRTSDRVAGVKRDFSVVFGKSRVQISAWLPNIRTKVVHILPLLLQENEVVENLSWIGSRPLCATFPSWIAAPFCHIPYWIAMAFCHILQLDHGPFLSHSPARSRPLSVTFPIGSWPLSVTFAS